MKKTLLCFSIFISGCSGFFGSDSPPVPRKTIITTKIPVSAEGTSAVSQKDGDDVCFKALGAFDAEVAVNFETDKTPVLDVRSGREFSEADLIRRLANLSERVYTDQDCPYKKISFRAPSEDGSYFEGKLFKENFQLYHGGKISLAEFSRRLEIRKLETLDSIKLKLADARVNGDHGYAMTLVESWLGKEPDSVTAKLIKANIALDKLDLVPAAALYEEILLGVPKNFTAWFNLAYAKKELGLYSDAAAIFKKLLDGYDEYEDRMLTPEDILLHQADAYLSNNQLDETEATLEKITDREFASYPMLVVNLKRARKKYDEAKVMLEKFVVDNPDSGVGRFNLVLAYLDLQDADGARKAYESLKSVSPVLADELKFISVFQPTKLKKKPLEEL